MTSNFLILESSLVFRNVCLPYKSCPWLDRRPSRDKRMIRSTIYPYTDMNFHLRLVPCSCLPTTTKPDFLELRYPLYSNRITLEFVFKFFFF